MICCNSMSINPVFIIVMCLQILFLLTCAHIFNFSFALRWSKYYTQTNQHCCFFKLFNWIIWLSTYFCFNIPWKKTWQEKRFQDFTVTYSICIKSQVNLSKSEYNQLFWAKKLSVVGKREFCPVKLQSIRNLYSYSLNGIECTTL